MSHTFNRLSINRFSLLLVATITLLLGSGKPVFAQTAPQLTSAATRKTHNTVNYDIGLPLTGATGIEPRNLTTGLTLVLNFDKPVASGNAAIAAGTATAGTPAFSGNSMLIPLTGIANAQAVTVNVTGVVATGGSSAGAASVTFRTLEGDINGSGTVSVADVNMAKYYVGQAVSGFNFRADLNANGSISVSDVNLAKFRVGTSVAGGAAANTAPTLSNIANTSTTTGTATSAINFTVGDGETPAGSIALSATSDNQTLLPNSAITLGGSGAARTITLAPAAGQTGTATVTVTASDGILLSTDTFVLTVNAQSTGGGTSKLFVATLSPENGALSSGSGSATLQLSADETYAIVKVAYSNLTTTRVSWHVHGPADPGQTGAVIFDLDSTAPQADGSWKWNFVQSGVSSPADQVAAIKAGRTYVNVHSSKYPSGELRGHFQVVVGSQTFTPPAAPPALPNNTPTQAEAARFLMQATYGPDDTSIAAVVSQGYDQWITNQLNMTQTSQAAILAARRSAGDQITFNTYNDSWWKLADTAPDQLRQRIAFAMSQYFVVSQNASILMQVPDGMALYYDFLGRDGTNNFRTLLENVTLNPMMGEYLNMRNSRKADPARGTNPNENYAREILQLFSIGLYQLHPDGTLKLDANGQPIPTYDQNTVIGFARAFTGWNYYQTGTSDVPTLDFNHQMTPMPQFHETGTKTLLNGFVIPAGGDNYSDLKAALDNIFNHPNVGPFVCKQLIQRLVCSNPSPGYVYRVAQKFADNGQGVRGDMKAVIRAILTDYEARSPDVITQQGYGKLKEPLLRTSAVMRAFHPYSLTNNWAIDNTDQELAQTAMNAVTVFNFFQPGYSMPGVIAQNGLVAPEFQITNETTTMSVANWQYYGIWGGWKWGDIKINLQTEQNLAGNPTALVDRLNLLMCAGQLPDAAKTIIINHINSLPASDPLTRAKTAVYLVAISPQFAIQR